MKERKPDGGLAEWIETLEAMGGEDDGEMLCLLLELRRFREDKPELIEQLEALKAKNSMTMGVGMGDENLFVHGDYESIKAALDIVFRMEAAEAQVKELTADLDKESEIRHRIHEELNAIKGEQQPVVEQLEVMQRERDEAVLLRLEVSAALSSATVRYEQAEAELKRRDAQEPVDAVNAGEEIYKIANHIASAKGGMPDEWQSWADEIESDLRRCVAPAAVLPVISGKQFTGALNALNDCLDDCLDSEQGLMLAFRAAGLEVKF